MGLSKKGGWEGRSVSVKCGLGRDGGEGGGGGGCGGDLSLR